MVHFTPRKKKPSFIMGTNTFIKTPIILSFYDQALIKYRIDQGQSLISVFLPDADYWPEIEIIDNDIVANGNAFWDIQFSTNYLRLRKRKGESFLEIDLRGEDAKVAGNFIVGGENFMFSPQATNFAGVKISNSRVEKLRYWFRIWKFKAPSNSTQLCDAKARTLLLTQVAHKP